MRMTGLMVLFSAAVWGYEMFGNDAQDWRAWVRLVIASLMFTIAIHLHGRTQP